MTKKWNGHGNLSRSSGEYENNHVAWDRSSSEPDLTDPTKLLERFTIKCPHEYISVDDLKFFRRKKPIGSFADFHTASSFCLFDKDEPVLPFSCFKTEYMKSFKDPILLLRPELLRQRTTLQLDDGLMDGLTEQQSQFHKYTNEEILSCRTIPIRNPEQLTLEGEFKMTPEYRSSFISYPLVDRRSKILPREVFNVEADLDVRQTTASVSSAASEQNLQKYDRDLAAMSQKKCHLKLQGQMSCVPEYQSQYIEYPPIEKSHSIPQLSSIKMQGKFIAIPEYRDSFKMYDSYSKSAPIKKADHLTMGGEIRAAAPEYRDKFQDPEFTERTESLRTKDHLHPRGEFSKEVPEYCESFKDPQIRQKPERGKCREPYLRLKGKIEFNPEYSSNYMDHPRSRPVVKKSTTSIRLSTNGSSPRRKFKSTSPNRQPEADPNIGMTQKPEYRKAQYNYQIRERTPTRKITESQAGSERSYSKTFTSPPIKDKVDAMNPKVGTKPRNRRNSSIDGTSGPPDQHFETVGQNANQKAAKFGRRASITRNSQNCRENSSIIEGNPKYATSRSPAGKQMAEGSNSSFVVLNEPCKQSSWMKKSWYDS